MYMQYFEEAKNIVLQRSDRQTIGMLDQLKYVESIGDKVIISAPNDFVKNYAEKHNYIAEIEQTLSNISNSNIQIEIIVNKDRLSDEELIRSTINTTGIPLSEAKRYNLDPRYSFERFVPGKNSEHAYAAAQNVANNPGKVFNPLFIYGGVGLGKTHLMHAIGNEVTKNMPHMRIACITSEGFLNEFVKALRDENLHAFRLKFRRVDLLLIDDVQFFGKKESVTEELFHTFEKLYHDKKQMVFTSDKPPADLKNMHARIRNRFAWGLVINIDPPDYETRRAILLKKAKELNLTLSNEVADYVATVITSNVRELEGALNTIKFYTGYYKRELTLDDVKNILKDVFVKSYMPELSIDKIQKAVCNYYNISRNDIKSKQKHSSIVRPRMVAMYLAKELIQGITYKEIGEEFGNREHSTVMNACKKINIDMKKDPNLKAQIDIIINKLRQL